MIFCTAINCMDGRVQLPVIQFLQKRFAAAYVDMITEPGPIRILSEQADASKIDAILQRLNISVDKHFSQRLAVIGHHDCAGNPVSEAEQIDQIKKSVLYLKNKHPQLDVIGLWVDANWKVNEVV